MVAAVEYLTSNNFFVELTLDGSKEPVDGTFLECQGFQCTQDVIEICEVTANKWGSAQKGQVVKTKIPGNINSGNLTLSRCLSYSPTFWKWFETVYEGNWAKQAKDASITILSQANKPQARFELAGAWPANYKIGDVNAQGTEMLIEEVEIAFQSFKRTK